jgi:hypothetical protein
MSTRSSLFRPSLAGKIRYVCDTTCRVARKNESF